MKAAATDHQLTARIVAGLAVVSLIGHLLTIPSLRLLSRRTLLHRMRAPSRFRLRRSGTAECILVADRTDFDR